MAELEATGVVKAIAGARVIAGVDLEVEAGSMVCLCGRSGSGKTTLLGLLGGLDRPDAGRIEAAGRVLTALDGRELEAHRLLAVGFIFQSAGLVPLMTAAENVSFPLQLAGVPEAEAELRGLEALEAVGLGARTRHRGFELSGGEQLRVAIARAVAKRPRVLLADEPTGQLDSETAVQVLRLLERVAEAGTAVLVATHDPALAAAAGRVLWIEDGVLVPEPVP